MANVQEGVTAILWERGVLRRFALTLLLVLTAIAAAPLSSSGPFRDALLRGDLGSCAHQYRALPGLQRLGATLFALLYSALLAFVAQQYATLKRKVFMYDFHVYKPAEHLKVSTEYSMNGFREINVFTEESMKFQEKIMQHSGISEYTYVPKGMKEKDISLAACLEEAETVMYQVVDCLFKKTGIDPKTVDIVITTSTIFAPTPSLGSMVMNHLKMRNDVYAYSIAGQGCSSGVVAVELADKLLQAMPEKRVLIVAHENISGAVYLGNNRSFLLSNCMFRIGGAAALLSNRKCDRVLAKYRLQGMTRVHNAANDEAFGVICMREDEEGIKGIRLSRAVVPVAGRAIKLCLTRLAPLALDLSELVKVAMNKRYMPNFTKGIDHFLLHTGGKAVIDEVAKTMNLPETLAKPARETLWRFGNTCVASTYYILAYIESKQGVKKGDVVLQLGFGTGFKCIAGVWKANRDIRVQHPAWGDDVGLPGPIE